MGSLRVQNNQSKGLSPLAWLSVALLVSWLVLPFIPLAIWSVSRSWFFPDLLPGAYSLRAWRYVISPASDMLPAIGVTSLVALAVTFLSALIGVPAGRALGLYRFRGKALVEAAFALPLVLPPTVLGYYLLVALGNASPIGELYQSLTGRQLAGPACRLR